MSGKQQKYSSKSSIKSPSKSIKEKIRNSTMRFRESTKKKWDEVKKASKFETHNEFALHLLELHARSVVFESIPATDNRVHQGQSSSGTG